MDEYAFLRFCKGTVAALVLVVLWVSPVVADEDRYPFLEYVKAGTPIERSGYSVLVPVQTGPFQSIDWRRFRDTEAPESVVLNIGFGENHSWAATVKKKGTLEEGKAIREYAVQTYPTDTYSPLYTKGSETACVISDLIDSNAATYERFYLYVVLCTHPKTNEIYELLFAETNLMGRAPSEHFHDAAYQFLRSIEISGT